MKQKIAAILGSALLTLSSAHGAIVLATSHPNLDGITAPDTFIIDTVDTKLSSGFAGVGGFATLTDVQVQAFVTASDFAPLISDFVSFIGTDNFVTGMIFQNGAASPGAFAVQNNALNPTAFIGQTLYSFIGDGASLLVSNAVALFKHSQTLVADPLPPATANEVNLTLGSGTLLIGTPTTITTTDVALGIKERTEVDAIRLTPLAAIPEPSSLLLTALGALALLRRKR
jgi:PEP-CTERM motif